MRVPRLVGRRPAKWHVVASYTSYHPECSFAYPAWLNGTIYADFMNETWFEGEWAENGYWSGRTLYVCIKLHVWDNCS